MSGELAGACLPFTLRTFILMYTIITFIFSPVSRQVMVLHILTSFVSCTFLRREWILAVCIYDILLIPLTVEMPLFPKLDQCTLTLATWKQRITEGH